VTRRRGAAALALGAQRRIDGGRRARHDHERTGADDPHRVVGGAALARFECLRARTLREADHDGGLQAGEQRTSCQRARSLEEIHGAR